MFRSSKKIKKKANKYVCVIVHNYFPHVEPRALRQVKALLENNFKVDVVCLKKPCEISFESIGDMNIHRVPIKYMRNNLILRLFNIIHFFIRVFFKLNSLCKKNQYSLIHIHTHINFLIFIGFYQKLQGIPLILDMHDLLPEFFQGRYQNSFIKIFLKLTYIEEKISCQFADHIIVPTEEVRRILISRRILINKISVIMNLADKNLFNQVTINRGELRNGLELLYYGTLYWFYNFDVVLRGLFLAIQEYPDITLTILGGGQQKKDIQKLIHILNIKKNIFFKEPIPPEKIRSLINERTVGILPVGSNQYSKIGLPTKLLEYASMGIPVICAKVPALESYFNKTMVEFFELENAESFANAVKNLYKDSQRRKILSNNITFFNKKYNWENEKQILFRTYHQLASREI